MAIFVLTTTTTTTTTRPITLPPCACARGNYNNNRHTAVFRLVVQAYSRRMRISCNIILPRARGGSTCSTCTYMYAAHAYCDRCYQHPSHAINAKTIDIEPSLSYGAKQPWRLQFELPDNYQRYKRHRTSTTNDRATSGDANAKK